jgi:uncharacterized protein (DUF1501 family)
MIQPSCAGPRISRRQMLQIGGAGLLGLTLPGLLRARGQGRALGQHASADHLIVIFLNGGPSHLDMWDMKPTAPADIRGEFQPIATTVPGVQVSEHLPRLARHMHKATLVRSMHHSVNNAHAAAVYVGLTGHDRGEIGGGARPTDHPALGSVAGLVRPVGSGLLPYVSLPFITKEGAGGPPQPGFTGGWLGHNQDPLFVLRDPNSPTFAMPELGLTADVDRRRLDQRRGLAVAVDQSSSDRALQDMDQYQARAFDLLTSPATQRAFQIEREASAVRDSYGRNIYGQSVLLARRLVEAGTRVVTLSWAPDANATWDTHGNNFAKLKNELLPALDAAVASLLGDLEARGMLERTLVAVMGEFGRTPRINTNGGGRDHWNFCYTLMLAGGGIKGGHVHGASDRIGGQPSLNPVTPADIIATIYHCLGIPADLELRDRLDRPMALVPWGSTITDVLV